MQIVDADTGEITANTDEQSLALLDGKFKFTPTGLIVNGEPTFAECEYTVHNISELGRLAPIWLGDLLNYMENRWGDKYAQVLGETGLSYQTVVNTKSVMGRVPMEVRQDGLRFTHYATVASSPVEDQKRLLGKAKTEELDTTEFKREVRKSKRLTTLGKLPRKVELKAEMTFTVPTDLQDKLQMSIERLTERLEEWDIECTELEIRRIE